MAGQNMSRRSILAAAAATPVAFAVGAASAQTGGEASRPNGKVALVTGSSRGIGAATAKRLAKEGFAVTVNCVVNRDLAAGIVKDIEAAGGRAIWRQADVSDPAAVQQLFDASEQAFGGVDVVVSNAGIMRLAPTGEMTDADFNRMVDVNLKGSFYVLRQAARRVRSGGRIIALSSSITLLRSPTYGPYAVTKAAQELYTNVLAKELADRMISVNAMAPGLVKHDPVHRWQDTPKDPGIHRPHAAQASRGAIGHRRRDCSALRQRWRLGQRPDDIRQWRHRLIPSNRSTHHEDDRKHHSHHRRRNYRLGSAEGICAAEPMPRDQKDLWR
jgi:3-oxoacyl-[acyl-carrier protein] reductase